MTPVENDPRWENDEPVSAARYRRALVENQALRTSIEEERERYRGALSPFTEDDMHVALLEDDFGPSTITLYLSGSKAERVAQVTRFRALLSTTEAKDG